MNAEMRTKLGLEMDQVMGLQLEELLTIGSKIFYQTHFYPLIKMQNSVREIYLVFKGASGAIPVLLNVEVKQPEKEIEIICGGMEITNRNRFEKELLVAKKTAEDALKENAELKKVKNELVENQRILETQFRQLKSLKEHQQEVFKLIAHDLQEPLRKSMFFSNYMLSKSTELSKKEEEGLHKIISFNSKMSEMLLTLLRFKELEELQLDYSKISLPKVIKEALTELNLENDKYIVVTCSEKCPEFYADNRLLTRLFIELLKNSNADRIEENQTLTVEIAGFETTKNSFLEVSGKYQYDKFIKITYTDNGMGLRTKFSEIIQNHVEVDKINIGLAYCKQIIEKHSGTIDARSVKGKGVSYNILLPLQQSTQDV